MLARACGAAHDRFTLQNFKLSFFTFRTTLQDENCTTKEEMSCNNDLRKYLFACLDCFPFTDTNEWFGVAQLENFLKLLGVHFRNAHLSRLLGQMEREGVLEFNRFNNKKYYRIQSGRNTTPKNGNIIEDMKQFCLSQAAGLTWDDLSSP